MKSPNGIYESHSESPHYLECAQRLAAERESPDEILAKAPFFTFAKRLRGHL